MFKWLVEYHCKHNLEACLPYIQDGIFSFPEGHDIEEGYEENTLPSYKGLVIFANGDTLIDKLRENEVILDKKEPEFREINSNTSLFNYIDSVRNSDGAYVFNSIKSKMAKVRLLNNNPYHCKDVSLEDMLPENFLSEDGSVDTDEIGTKTRLAATLPAVYTDESKGQNVETYQIKRTAYGNLKMGKVTHFDKDGLNEEFFLQYDPEHKGSFINEEAKIVGVYRRYERLAGDLIQMDEVKVGREFFEKKPAYISSYSQIPAA